MTLDIKTQKSWKFKDKLCIGCRVNCEMGDEILSYTGMETEQEKGKILHNQYFMICSLLENKVRW